MTRYWIGFVPWTLLYLGGCRDTVAPVEQVDPSALSNAPPPWQPIGPVLAFQRGQNGSSDIFRVAASGNLKYLRRTP
jgi:hypothetical protein